MAEQRTKGIKRHMLQETCRAMRYINTMSTVSSSEPAPRSKPSDRNSKITVFD